MACGHSKCHKDKEASLPLFKIIIQTLAAVFFVVASISNSNNKKEEEKGTGAQAALDTTRGVFVMQQIIM